MNKETPMDVVTIPIHHPLPVTRGQKAWIRIPRRQAHASELRASVETEYHSITGEGKHREEACESSFRILHNVLIAM